jgi:acid phosphatase type 7
MVSPRRICLAISVLLLVLTSSRVQSADQILVAAGSSWRYNDSGTNLGTGWRGVTYNDGSWLSGLAQLGYGDGDEATVISYGGNVNNRRITYYFRRSFTVADPAAISALAVLRAR